MFKRRRKRPPLNIPKVKHRKDLDPSNFPCPLEEDEQKNFVYWLALNGFTYSAIPSGTYTTSMQARIKNKRLGVKKGLPDLIIYIEGERTIIDKSILLFVEMKRKMRKCSYVNDFQKDWIKKFNTVDCVEAKICFGCDEAIDFVSKFIKNK